MYTINKLKTKRIKECKRMSPKGKHIKKRHKDESSDFYVEDKQVDKKKNRKEKSYGEDKQVEKKKHHKEKSSDVLVEDKQLEKKKHKDKSSNVYSEERKFKEKKRSKDKSSGVHVEDKQFFDDSQRDEFVYYDPSIIQEAEVFQATSEHPEVSQENAEAEGLDHFFQTLEQYSDEGENGVEATDQDEMNE